MADKDPMAELPKMDPVTPTPAPQARPAQGVNDWIGATLVLGVLSLIVLGGGGLFGFIAMFLGAFSVCAGLLAMALGRRWSALAGVGMAAGIVGAVLGANEWHLHGPSQILARRVVCGTNLNAIGKGFGLYCADSYLGYPWVSNITAMRYDAPMRAAADIDSLDGNPNGEGTQCNILQNLSLLVKTGVVSWKVFRCPAVGRDLMQRDATSLYGFQWDESKKTNYCDYAYHIGYINTIDGHNAAPLYVDTDVGMPIMADRAPSADAAVNDFYQTQSGSPNRGDGWNHGADGVQVLTAGGSVYWSAKTIRSGLAKNNRDVYGAYRPENGPGNNIYLRDMDPAGNVVAPSGMKTPVYENDSVLFWSRGDK